MSARHTAKARHAVITPSLSVESALVDLRKADGARILATRLYDDTAGLGALVEEHGELAIRAVQSVLTRAMINGSKVASVRSWRYFGPVIAAESKAEGLCVECREHPRAGGGRLTRCLGCIKAAAQQVREARAVAEARAKKMAKRKGPVRKTCRTCRVA